MAFWRFIVDPPDSLCWFKFIQMPSIRRHRRRHYARRGIVALIVAAIGVVLYIGLSSDYWKQLVGKVSPIINKSTKAESDPTPPASESDFETFLSQSNAQQLILKSTELADDRHEELVTRLDVQQKKIRIADVLLNQAGNARAQTFGISTKLKAMRTRELIDFDHGLTSEANLNELTRVALLHVDSKDDNTKRQALMGRLLAILIQSAVFDGTDRPDSIESALREYQSVSDQNVRDAEVANELYSYLQRIHLRAAPAVFQQFVDAFKKSYGGSDRAQLRKLAENVAAEISESEFDFADILGESGLPQSDAIERLSSQIREALERTSVSQQGFVAIQGEIRRLATVGQYDVALELADQLQRRIAANDALLPLASSLKRDREQYRLVGTEFSLDGIMTLDNQPFSVRHGNAPVKALIFMTAEAMQQTQNAIGFIMNIARKYLDEGRFCLSVIYLDNGDNATGLAEIKRMAELVAVIDFGRIDLNSEPGKAAMERLAIISAPMVMLLDRENRVRGIDVNKVDFEVRFKEMLSRN